MEWLDYWNASQRNRKLIQMDFLWDGGKFVKCDWGKWGILVGVLEDDYDWYWIIEDTDLKLVVSSCVGGYTVAEDNNIPPECTVLQWMQEHDKDGLMNRIKEQLKKYTDSGDRIMIGLVVDDNRETWNI